MGESKTVKATLSFPKDLLATVKERVGKGEVSRYVAEAVRERIEAEERKTLCRELAEGYRVRASLHKEFTSEFFEAEAEAYVRAFGHGESQRKTAPR